jgi:hypothetical protein
VKTELQLLSVKSWEAGPLEGLAGVHIGEQGE